MQANVSRAKSKYLHADCADIVREIESKGNMTDDWTEKDVVHCVDHAWVTELSISFIQSWNISSLA